MADATAPTWPTVIKELEELSGAAYRRKRHRAAIGHHPPAHRQLDRLATVRGYPAVLRCDNSPNWPGEATADWAGERVSLSYIPLGEPWRNG